MVGTLIEVRTDGSSFSHIFCPLPIAFVPLKELTRIVIVKALKQGEAIADVACTLIKVESVMVPEGTKRVVATEEGP